MKNLSILKNLITLNIFLGLFLYFNYFFMAIIDVPWGDTLLVAEEYLKTNKFKYIFTAYGDNLVVIPRLVDVFVYNFFNGSQTLKAYFYQFFYIINFLLFYNNLSKNYPNEKLLWALCLVIIFFFKF